VCDYNFIIGDLNYRFETTYDEMNKNNEIKNAIDNINTLDQLKISMNRHNDNKLGMT